jgi:tetratricopeptide (TPR) repeat protein
MKKAHRALIVSVLLMLCFVTGALARQAVSFKPDVKVLRNFIKKPYREVSKQLCKIPPVEATGYAVLLGKIHLFQFNNIYAAEHYFSFAFAYARQHDFNRANILLSLAQVNAVKQQLQKTVEYLDKAVVAAKEENDPGILRTGLICLGNITYHSGDFDKSLTAYDQLLELAVGSDDMLLQAQVLFDISEVCYKMEDYKRAKKSVTRAIDIFIRCENEKGLADCYNMLGGLSLINKNSNEALNYYLTALSHYKNTNDWHGRGNCNHNLGVLYKKSKNYNLAAAALEKAVYFFTKSASTEGVGIAQMELGRVCYLQKEYDKAEGSLKQAEFLLNEIKALYRLAQTQDYLGDLKAAQKDPIQAATYYRVSAANYRKLSLWTDAERISKKLEKLDSN